MKRKTVTAFLLSLCLAVTMPGTVSAADIQSQTVEAGSVAVETQAAEEISSDEAVQEETESSAKEAQRTDENADGKAAKSSDAKERATSDDEKKSRESTGEKDSQLQDIEDAVKKAAAEKELDMSSTVMQDFIKASNTYDALSDSEKDGLSAETKDDIVTVRERIAGKIHTADAVTADSSEWYIQTQMQDYADTADVLKAAEKKYPGCTPRIVYGKSISYTDIRTGDSYTQKQQMSMTVAIPKGYDTLTNPKIVRYENGELIELSPEKKEDGFYIQRARYVDNIFILDAPILLTGLQLDSELGVNVGQKFTLTATPLPAGVTQDYQLVWTSSDPTTVSVDQNGTVTAYKEGTATITVSVADNPSITAACQVKAVQGAHALTVSVAKVLDETRGYMQSVDKNPTLGSEWFVLGLARSGVNTDSTYFQTYYNHIANYLKENNGKLTSSVKYTEYSKMILVMTSMGKDARNIAGYNLFEPLADFQTVTEQGTNGPIWALIALHSNPVYTIPTVNGVKTQTTEQRLIDYILEKETKKGGWSMSGDAPDPDLTGMTLQALAPYYQVRGYEKVTEAIDRSLEVLSSLQNKNGGYSTMGVETSESAAQVLTALCALGIDPMQDERFVKGGNWIVENLLTYHISGSGFMHVKKGAENNGGGAAGAVNGMATEQAYYALTAYQRMLDEKTSLYDMSDIQLEKGEAGDGKGTGLEEPKTDDTKKEDTKSAGTDTVKKDDTKKDTTKTTGKTKTTTKKKLTYKGKRLTLSTGSGKKLTLSGSSSDKKLTLADGTAAESGDGWDFEPEDYIEGEEEANSGKLTLSDALDQAEEPDGTEEAVTDTDEANTQMQQGEGASRTEAGTEAGTHSWIWFLGGAAVGVLAVLSGIWFYVKKKKA